MYSKSKRQHTDTVQSMRQQLRFLEFTQARNSHYSVRPCHKSLLMTC